MEPKHVDDIRDILPLICVPKLRLEQFKRILEAQETDNSIENPIYSFSAKLKVSTAIHRKQKPISIANFKLNS